METIWRPVKGYEGLYEVSNTGLVRSVDRYAKGVRGCERLLKGEIKKPRLTERGYLTVSLSKDRIGTTFKVHRLVAQAFPEVCGEWFDGCQINHKNEVKTDNRAENLETCTNLYNHRYGTCNSRASATKQCRGKRVLQYDSNDRLVAIFASPKVAENMYGPSIYHVLKGRCKTAYGYTFKYYDDVE